MEKSKKIPGTDILVLEEFIASSDDDMEIHASVAAGFDTRKNLVVRLKYTDYDFPEKQLHTICRNRRRRSLATIQDIRNKANKHTQVVVGKIRRPNIHTVAAFGC